MRHVTQVSAFGHFFQIDAETPLYFGTLLSYLSIGMLYILRLKLLKLFGAKNIKDVWYIFLRSCITAQLLYTTFILQAKGWNTNFKAGIELCPGVFWRLPPLKGPTVKQRFVCKICEWVKAESTLMLKPQLHYGDRGLTRARPGRKNVILYHHKLRLYIYIIRTKADGALFHK